MKITRETTSALMIRSITPEGIRIGDKLHVRTIALTTDSLFENWQDKHIADLEMADFAVLLETGPEVILLGTGRDNQFPPRDLVFAMARRRIGFETMDTAAAARTYNVLASEGRKVAAVLYW